MVILSTVPLGHLGYRIPPLSLLGTSGETDPCIGFGTDLDPVPDLKTKNLRIIIVEQIYFHIRNFNTLFPSLHEVR